MGSRDDLSLVNPDMAALLGRYETHRFCMRINPEAQLVDNEGKPKRELDKNTLALIVHEYYHYLHNLSTPAGFAGYQMLQQILAAFSHAIEDDGTCVPERMPPNACEQLEGALRAWSILDGAVCLPTPRPTSNLEVLGALLNTVELVGVKVEQAVVRFQLQTNGGPETLTVPIGAVLVQEGIAYLLEQFVRQERVTFDTEGIAPPEYPYRAFAMIVQALSPGAGPLTAVRIGALSLCTNRPGATLVHALHAHDRLMRGGSDDASACRAVRHSMAQMIVAIVQRICSQDLGEIAQMHFERGIVGTGHALALSQFQALLARRAETPWWDMEWCREDGTVDLRALSRLLLSTVPCDAIQERVGDENSFERDYLLTFRPGGLEREDGSVSMGMAESGLRAVHAQLDYLLAHLTTAGLRATATPSPRPCPYFTSCRLDMRKGDSLTCKNEPWRRLTFKGETCWYGIGVAATLGLLARPT